MSAIIIDIAKGVIFFIVSFIGAWLMHILFIIIAKNITPIKFITGGYPPILKKNRIDDRTLNVK